MREKMMVRNVGFIRDIYNPGDDLPDNLSVSILVDTLSCEVIR